MIPVAALASLRAARRRDAAWAALGRDGPPAGDGGRAWLAASVLLILALAGPRWGRLRGSALPPGHDVVLVLDASRSMAAEDATPDRAGVAVAAATALVKALGPGDRAAVVAFAGRGAVRCPLTANLGAALDAIRAVRPGSVRPGGTDLGAAIDAAAGCFDSREPADGRALVVFSDGEDQAPSWQDAIDRLRTLGVAGHGVAIGDEARGHEIPLPGADPPMVRFGGAPVLSKRVDAGLDALAEETGGVMIRLGLEAPGDDLGRLYRDRIAPSASRAVAGLRPSDRADRYSAFVLAAFGLGVAGSRGVRRRPSYRRRLAAVAPCLVLLASAAPAPPRGPAEAVSTGRAEYAAARHAQALAAFDEAIRLAPGRPVPLYDAAAALYQLGRYPEAIARDREARALADARLRVKIDYALGNAHLAMGKPAESIPHFDACLASTARGSGLDAVRRDAAINRRFAQEQLARSPAPSPARPPDRPKPGDESDDGRDPGGGPDGGAGDRPPSRGGPAEDPGPSPPRGSPPGQAGRSLEGNGRQFDAASPESRLSRALSRAREARKLRLPEDDSRSPGQDGKDW